MTNFQFSQEEWEEGKFKTIYKGLIPPEEFWKNMKVKKAQGEFECIICSEHRVKGTRYIGTHYQRICFFCFLEWLKNSKSTCDTLKERFNEIEKELNENKEKWEKEYLVESL